MPRNVPLTNDGARAAEVREVARPAHGHRSPGGESNPSARSQNWVWKLTAVERIAVGRAVLLMKERGDDSSE